MIHLLGRVRKALLFGLPLAFLTWGAHLLIKVRSYTIPAFGSVQAHLDAYRTEMVGETAVGVWILALWIFAWAFLPKGSTGRKRPWGGRLQRRPLRASRSLRYRVDRKSRESLRSVD